MGSPYLGGGNNSKPRKEFPMEGILSTKSVRAKQRLLEQLKFVKDAGLRTRYLIVIHLMEGSSPTWIARSLKVSRGTVYRVKNRFLQEGDAGLFDRRNGNGKRKLTEEYLKRLSQVVAGDPSQWGWPRPTWTRELQIKTLQK